MSFSFLQVFYTIFIYVYGELLGFIIYICVSVSLSRGVKEPVVNIRRELGLVHWNVTIPVVHELSHLGPSPPAGDSPLLVAVGNSLFEGSHTLGGQGLT